MGKAPRATRISPKDVVVKVPKDWQKFIHKIRLSGVALIVCGQPTSDYEKEVKKTVVKRVTQQARLRLGPTPAQMRADAKGLVVKYLVRAQRTRQARERRAEVLASPSPPRSKDRPPPRASAHASGFASGLARAKKAPPRAKKAPPRAKKAPPRARKSVRKPTAAKKVPRVTKLPAKMLGFTRKPGDRTKVNGYSEAGRKPRCRCTSKTNSRCPKSDCPNFDVPKLGSSGKWYHPQSLLDRRP